MWSRPYAFFTNCFRQTSVLFLAVGSTSAWMYASNNKVYAKTICPLRSGEQRFRQFASLEYNGVLYMTPSDFLRSLTKDQPQGSPAYFELAFKMLDRGSDGTVDFEEFSRLNPSRSKINESSEALSSNEEDEEDISLDDKNPCRTTLMVHLFGPNCSKHIAFKDFTEFVRNLQMEALEVEFYSHSMGAKTIKPVDFANILLRHSTLDKGKRHAYLERLQAYPKHIPTGSDEGWWDHYQRCVTRKLYN